MKKTKSILWLLLIGVIAARCGTVEPTATPTPAETATPTVVPTPTEVPPYFELSSNKPVVTHGDWLFVNPGATFVHDGQIHMFYNSFSDWPAVIDVRYAVSDDGVNWEGDTGTSLFAFTPDDADYINTGVNLGSGYVTDDGTWVLYFHTFNSLGKPGVVGRMTAPAPEGPWTLDAEPVLLTGEKGEWDDRGFEWARMMVSDAELVMYYGGISSVFGSTISIGRATSVDGVNWVKYDDPETTEAPFAVSDPVSWEADGWYAGESSRPSVVHTDDGFLMVYMQNNINERGVAYSEDGIHWVDYDLNPVITRDLLPDIADNTWDMGLIVFEDELLYFIEIGTMAGTNIYLISHEGPLRP